jgi:ankyrin repeat protein
VIEKPAVKTVPLTDKSPPKTTTATEKAPERISPVTNAAITLTAPATDKPPINTVTTMNQATEKDTTEPATVKKNTNPDYEKLVSEAIEKKDSALINKAVQNGAGKTIKGIYGGNLFHILDHTLASEDFILLLKRKGFSIDESDDYGNSPLHFAILTGRNDYARSLINQGADINIKNRSDLSPLHLAVLLNNTGLVKDLLRRGAELNQKGKNGYSPLHIASELNYAEAALNLLNSGAEIRIKTDQKLTPKAIAKIQKNTDIVKLIRNKNSFDPNLLGLASSRIFSQINNDGTKYPDIRFDLAFDKKLSQKRQFNKFIQILSIPVIVISAGSTAYLRSEANHYYSLSKIAETEAMGKVYYDKTRQYDRYTYIAGGVSIVSIYGFIHSTIRKKNISNKMHKTLY